MDPRRAWRSTNNYAHLLAERLDLELVDVTYSGVAGLLASRFPG
jgi:hypothetical protein